MFCGRKHEAEACGENMNINHDFFWMNFVADLAEFRLVCNLSPENTCPTTTTMVMMIFFFLFSWTCWPVIGDYVIFICTSIRRSFRACMGFTCASYYVICSYTAEYVLKSLEKKMRRSGHYHATISYMNGTKFGLVCIYKYGKYLLLHVK